MVASAAHRHRTNASTMITAATMAQMPSALMVAPQRSISNLSDMCSSPLKKRESLHTMLAAILGSEEIPKDLLRVEVSRRDLTGIFKRQRQVTQRHGER